MGGGGRNFHLGPLPVRQGHGLGDFCFFRGISKLWRGRIQWAMVGEGGVGEGTKATIPRETGNVRRPSKN